MELYWAREERALIETERKYGNYCWSIAHNILKNREDTEECVNDTYMKAWNSMPPQRPCVLSAFLGRITRNLSLDRVKHGRSVKRGGGQLNVALEELKSCIPVDTGMERMLEELELSKTVDRFLRELPGKERCIFLRRYWYVDSLLDIALRYHMSESGVKSCLHRTRRKLREFLEREGVVI